MESRGHQILFVQAVSFSFIKAAVSLLLLAAVAWLCLLHSLYLAIAIPIYLMLIAIHIISNHHKEAFDWLYYCHQTYNEASTLAVYTQASRQGHTRSSPKVFIIKVHHRTPEYTYFLFKGEIYRLLGPKAELVPPVQKLRLLGLTDIQAHLETGLTPAVEKLSKSLFGEQSNLITPAAWRLVLRRYHQQSAWLLLLLLAQLLSVEFDRNHVIWHFAADVLILIIILLQSCKEAYDMQQQYSWIHTRTFTILRDSVEQQAAVTALMVGDVIIPHGEGEFVFWFDAVLAGTLDLVVRQELRESVKEPLKDTGRGQREKQQNQRHAIMTHSKVERGQLKEGERFVVVDHSVISRYFVRWFQKPMSKEFALATDKYKKSAFIVIASGVLLLLAQYVLLSLFERRHFFPLPSDMLTLTVSTVLLTITFLVFLWMLLVFVARLKLASIKIFGSAFLQAGITQHLLINFSRLLHLEFQEILNKNKLLGFQTQIFEPSAETLQNGTTYESLLAVIIYLSLGKFQENNSMLAQVFQKYNEYYEYEELLGQFPDVIHVATGKKWELLKAIPENEEGMRSWVVYYDQKIYFLLSQVPAAGEPFKHLSEREDYKKKEVYQAAAKELKEEGKVMKVLLFRNLKEGRLRESADRESDIDYTTRPREKLERQLDFGTFLIFDHALLNETVQGFDEFKTQEAESLNINFISSSTGEELAGFEHILTNIPFIYGCKQAAIAEETRKRMKEGGCMLIGGGVEDIQAANVTDLLVQATSKRQEFLLPGDVVIDRIQDLMVVLRVARWALDLILELWRLAIAMVIFQIFAIIFLERTSELMLATIAQKEIIVTISLSLGLPLLLKLLLFPRQTSKTSKIEPKGLSTETYWLGLGAVLLLSALLCMLTAINRATMHKQEGIRLREPPLDQEGIFGLILVVGGSAALLVFIGFYGKQNWLRPANKWSRLLLLPFWVLVLFLINTPFWLILISTATMLLIFSMRGLFRRCVR